MTNTSTDQSAATDQLLKHYRNMFNIRLVEEEVLRLRKEEQVAGSVHVCVGQESAPVGVCSVLDERDRVTATYRGHGWAMAKGVTPFRLLSEVLGRATGTNGGRAGSPYLTAPDVGFVGENSIVGAGLPIANGVALALQQRGEGGVSVVSFGDGATNQGASHEAFVFAVFRNLPVVFICENNAWSEMTPISATVPHTNLYERAATYGMPAEIVDGTSVLAVQQAAERAVARARNGEGPSFIEITVPRILGHYNADIQQYRTAEDSAEHAARDPLAATREALIAQGIDEGVLSALEADVKMHVENAVSQALAAPLPDVASAKTEIVAPANFAPVSPLPTEGKEIAMGLAINKAFDVEFEQRSNLVTFGEDIAIPGGTFGVTRNLQKRYGESRVFDTPISEAAILGAAVGASTEGLLPVVEIMWSDFLMVAFDQLVNQAANVRFLSTGRVTAPMVVRMQQGATPGSCAQHSQSLEALVAHIPGLKVGLPSTGQDGFSMLRAAIADPDPVVLIEARALYFTTGILDVDAPREAVGGARLRRAGSDALVVTWGTMVNQSLEAADLLSQEGVSVAVLDLRWLNPLDEELIAQQVRAAGGRVVVAHEANLTGGFGAEVAARISQNHWAELVAPVARVGSPDIRVPASPHLMRTLVPNASVVADAVRQMLRST